MSLSPLTSALGVKTMSTIAKVFRSKKYGTLTVSILKQDKSKTTYLVDHKITKEEAEIIQLELGYHPYGYGLYDFKQSNGSTTWYRWNSCD